MVPRMLLHRGPGGGGIPRSKLIARFEAFGRGEWLQQVAASEACDDKAAVARQRQGRRGQQDTIENRTRRAEMLVQLGELSSARQALEGPSLAPGTEATLSKLTDETKRPCRPWEPLLRGVVGHAPVTPFDLDEKLFLRCLRSSRKGAAAGPSGMTTDNLRPLFKAGEMFARAEIPDTVIQMAKIGRMTALSKLHGGERGIVAGDDFRRLVARTMAQQLSTAVSAATAPHQCALSTRAGCECIAHVLQGLTEMDPRATVTSIDGVSAFDLISRGVMMSGVLQVDGAARLCHLFACSMEHCLNTLGKIPAAPCTESPKVKAANKATTSCLCSSPWVTRVRLKQLALSCGQGSASSLILTTSTW